MNLRQGTLLQGGKRGIGCAWGMRRVFLPLLVCMLAMVAGQSYAQYVTSGDVVRWRKAAEQGHAQAQYELGVCYYNGEVVDKDYDEAVKWWRKAAEQGHAESQYELGAYYFDMAVELEFEGYVVPLDDSGWAEIKRHYKLATEWWRKAAEQGHADASYGLGLCYHYGEGVRRDLAEAERWYSKAAAQGHAKAKDMLKELPKNTPSTSTVQAKDKSDTGMVNGHEWVDLGLSVKWATCNVGASSPSDYGDYYAWGETSTKRRYTKRTSKTYGVSMSSIAGNATYDAARANWGGTWRMPTSEEMKELVEKCTWTWTTLDEHNGYRVTGPNGKSIFLPAAGGRGGTSLHNAGSWGFYWSATQYCTGILAYDLNFTPSSYLREYNYRLWGHTIRPVTE